MMIDIERAAEILSGCGDVYILTHMNPDGDTLGSAFALMRALRSLGRRAEVKCSDRIPEKYSYMSDGLDTCEFEPDSIVAVDVATPELFGSRLEKYGGRVALCIDHHGSNTGYAASTLLDAASSSTCEIIFKVIKLLAPGSIDAKIASCLYTGISTDTGCFKFSNTTPESHMAAAELMQLGADSDRINRVMFETKSRRYFELERLAMETLEYHFDNTCAVMTITQDMFNRTGTDESDCDGLASLPRQIEGITVGITLREKPDGTFKASVRTHAPFNASDICAMSGGGGHARAAGCTLSAPIENAKAEMLKNAKSIMESTHPDF